MPRLVPREITLVKANGRVSLAGVVGASVSGTGLAQVVPDALTESERVRTALLWDRRP